MLMNKINNMPILTKNLQEKKILSAYKNHIIIFKIWYKLDINLYIVIDCRKLSKYKNHKVWHFGIFLKN